MSLFQGTEGSNPSPSSSESRANLTFGTHHSPIRCLARNLGQDCGIKPRRRRHYWLLGRPEDKTVEQVTTIAQMAAEHAGSCFPRGKGYPAQPAFLRSRAAPAGLVRIVDFGNGRGSDSVASARPGGHRPRGGPGDLLADKPKLQGRGKCCAVCRVSGSYIN
jgi:hypothetical protein